MNERRRPRRLIAGVLAGALAISVSPLVGLSPAAAADALPPIANPIASGAFCDGAPATNPFSDLGGESANTRETILCLVATQLTTGTTATTYTPGGSVTRRQMAVFIKRLADLYNTLETGSPPLPSLPTYDGSPDFADVSASDPGATAIGQLSQAGIVGGVTPGIFAPNAPVSRRQMAAFVNRLQDFLAGSPFSTSSDYFNDDNGDSGEANLNALAGIGIFQGDGAGNVNPGGTISRRQMANILLRYAQVYFAAGVIDSPFVTSNETLTFTPDTAATVQALNDNGADVPADNRTYTASGLPANAGGYRITLVQASKITNTGGDIVFTEDANTGFADAGVAPGQIVMVNGGVPAPADLNATRSSIGAVQPVAGSITVVVDGTMAGSLIPVIYTDQGGSNTRLNLGNDNRPTEPFGIAGQLNVTAAASNATLAITPTSAATLEFDATEPPPNTADDRQYTVTGLTAATNYTIQLFPAANVQGTNPVTFTELGATNTADDGAVQADITVANGAAVPGVPDDNVTVQPVGGQITFTVDGVTTETIVPVIFRDADADGFLDLNDADNTPVATEPFGVGGSIRYLPPEAVIGASGIAVTSVTPERDAFVSGGVTYYLDSNDLFKYQGVGISQAQFDSMLSPGDLGTANYNPDPAGVSVFDITVDAVNAPAAPTVTVINVDAGLTINDARITYTRPATNSPGVTYTLQRAVVSPGVDTVCGTLDDLVGVPATVATATQAAGTGTGVFVFSDNNVPNGCYSWRIQATSPVSNNTANSGQSGPATTIPTAADVTAPLSTAAARTTDMLTLDIDAGDVIKITFNEVMAAPTAGTQITLTDGDGTVATLTTTNSTFVLNPAGTELTITILTTPAPSVAGGTPGLALGSVVTNRAAITDLALNGWNLAGSPDKTI